MFVGLASKDQSKLGPKYLASVIQENGTRKFYPGHRWNVVAGTFSFESGIGASADEFGEIHLWRLSDAKPIKIFKPVGHDLHHIQWEPDESGILVGTRFLEKGKDSVTYDFNRYGPITHSFSFKRWDLIEDEREAKYLSGIRLLDSGGSTAFRAVYDSNRKDLRLDSVNGRSEYLLGYERAGNPKERRRVERWGNPTSITVNNNTASKQSHLLVGTDRGMLLEFSIQNISGANRLKLERQFLGHESKITALSISPSGKQFASASIDGTARIWSLSKARELADADFYTDGTRVIHMIPGGSAERSGIKIGDSIRRFAGGAYYERIQRIQNQEFSVGQEVTIGLVRGDGTAEERYLEFPIQLASTNDVQTPEVSLFFSKEDQWIAWTQDGYYNCSAQGDRHVGWHVNRGRENAADFSRVSQFQRQLYRPDLVQAVADGTHRKSSPQTPALAERDKADGTYSVLIPNTAKNYKEMRPPQITVQSHQSAATVDADFVNVEFSIETPIRLELLEASLFNNGKPSLAKFEEVESNNSGGIKTTDYRVRVPLEPGLNHLVFEAEHEHATSNRPSLKITRSVKQPKKTLPRLFVLAVGISKYENDEFNLQFADNDANDFSAALKKQSGVTFSEVVTKVLTNDGAAVDDIEDGFDWLVSQKPGSNDVVFVFLSGRAFYSPTDLWYFAGSDFDPERMKRTSISRSDISDILESELRKAGNVVAFLDTCRAVDSGADWPRVHHSQQGKDVWKSTRRPVLLSCYQQETSEVNPSTKNGYFANALVRALGTKKFDRKSDGLISFRELVSGTRKLLLTETNQSQTPSLSGLQLGATDFDISKLPQ